MIIISFAKQQVVSLKEEEKRYQSGTSESCGTKTKYSIVQHTMVILIQMVEGDC
jgi:hypothetical protein